MRNYIILNGRPSLELKGLLIQELPTIMKPPIRYNAEEIDGVDGDKVERLGYGAYDKELLIGLHGDFDLDEVIEYFDSSGEVIFSNEPDKYYRYEILEQIDFARLVRFREATVTFHVQPFKYSAVERRVITASNQFISIPDADLSGNGYDVTVDDGEINVEGSNVFPIDVYIPIVPAVLVPGTYTLTVTVAGAGYDNVALQLLDGPPTAEHAFGGSEIVFTSTGSHTLTATLSAKKTFKQIYLVLPAQQSQFTITLTLKNDAYSSVIRNNGNVFSKPRWTIYGSGDLTIKLNGSTALSIAMSTNGHITIDCATLDAYKDSKTNLKNRLCTGDYANLFLTPGRNTRAWTGQVDKIEIEDYSRWR